MGASRTRVGSVPGRAMLAGGMLAAFVAVQGCGNSSSGTSPPSLASAEPAHASRPMAARPTPMIAPAKPVASKAPPAPSAGVRPGPTTASAGHDAGAHAATAAPTDAWAPSYYAAQAATSSAPDGGAAGRRHHHPKVPKLH